MRSKIVYCFSLSDFFFFVLVETGEDKRIKEFYQSRGLERVIQPAGDGKSLSSPPLTD